MTVVLVALAGLAAAAATWWGTRRHYIREYDLHDYARQQWEARAARIRQVCADADHNRRLAARWERRHDEARAHIGDLTVALARARRPRRSPMPVYGTHREMTA